MINVMLLNQPETIPPPTLSVEKLSSTKPVPGAKKVGDQCSSEQSQVSIIYTPEAEQYSPKTGSCKHPSCLHETATTSERTELPAFGKNTLPCPPPCNLPTWDSA